MYEKMSQEEIERSVRADEGFRNLNWTDRKKVIDTAVELYWRKLLQQPAGYLKAIDRLRRTLDEEDKAKLEKLVFEKLEAKGGTRIEAGKDGGTLRIQAEYRGTPEELKKAERIMRRTMYRLRAAGALVFGTVVVRRDGELRNIVFTTARKKAEP